MGAMLAPMTTVAAKNPHAWFPIERTAAEIITPTEENRLVSEPYTKYSVAIMDVDMAAAVIVTSHAVADRLHIPRERRIYPRGWAHGHEVWNLAEREDMARAPGLAMVANAAMQMAGVTIDDIGPLDLYSCFASSLHLACDALGIDPTSRPLTVTGGLPYAGGPANNYMSHSIAAMVEALRAEPGVGMVSGVGMHMTKHVFGVYSNEPGPLDLVPEIALQQEINELPTRTITRGDGPATITTWTMTYERDGSPQELLAVCELPDGQRTYAATNDARTMAAATAEEFVGTPVSLSTGENGKTLLAP
jgi:acetyl-CoA C-acetyltransferase